MNRLMRIVLLIGLLPLSAAAQSSDYSKWDGYFYAAPGVRAGFDEPSVATVQIGGGGEGFFTRNLGLGGDVGSVRVSGNWTTVFSPNLIVRFRAEREKHKVEPFVTAGAVFFSGVNYQKGLNVGGGLNYWFRDHVGLRFEARDSFSWENEPPHFIGFRIGLAFR